MKPLNEKSAEPGSRRAGEQLTAKANHRIAGKSIELPPAVAWLMAGDFFRIQANTHEAAKRIGKIPGARRTGYSVAGRYLRFFDFTSNETFIRRISEEIGGVFLSESCEGSFDRGNS